MSEPSPPRRFSDEEVQGLIRRALALQERSSSPPSHAVTLAEGLTLADVRQIARDVGIEPHYVDLALSSHGRGQAESVSSRLAGGPYRWRMRHMVDGEVADEDRVRLLEEVRGALGHQGEVKEVLGTMEWSHDDGLGPVVVEVRSREGRTEIDVSANRASAAGLLVGLTSGLGGLGLGAVTVGGLELVGPVVLPVLLASAGACYLGSRSWWTFRSRVWERRLAALGHRLAGVASELTRPSRVDGEPREGEDA